MTEAVEVTQADRDAAAAYWKVSRIGNRETQRRYLSGEADNSLIVQAFARHRIAHQQAAGEVVAWLYTFGGGVVDVTNHRRDEGTLRALGWTETPLYAHPPAADIAAQREDAARQALEAAAEDVCGLVAEHARSPNIAHAAAELGNVIRAIDPARFRRPLYE